MMTQQTSSGAAAQRPDELASFDLTALQPSSFWRSFEGRAMLGIYAAQIGVSLIGLGIVRLIS